MNFNVKDEIEIFEKKYEVIKIFPDIEFVGEGGKTLDCTDYYLHEFGSEDLGSTYHLTVNENGVIRFEGKEIDEKDVKIA